MTLDFFKKNPPNFLQQETCTYNTKRNLLQAPGLASSVCLVFFYVGS